MLICFSGLALIVIGLVFEFAIGDMYNIWINFALAALVTLSFFLGLFEVVMLTLLALCALNWQPGIAPELAVMGILPVASFFIRKILPFEPWAGNVLVAGASIFILYILFGRAILIHSPSLFFLDLAGSAAYAAAAYGIMNAMFRRA